jgi:hypothetical protein
MAFLKFGQNVVNAMTGVNQNAGWIVPKRGGGGDNLRWYLNFNANTIITGISYTPASTVVSSMEWFFRADIAGQGSNRDNWTAASIVGVTPEANQRISAGEQFRVLPFGGSSVLTASQIIPGEPNEAAFTCDGTGTGAAVTSRLNAETVNATAGTAITTVFTIGGSQGGGVLGMQGTIANFKVYSDIAFTNLIHEWKIDDGPAAGGVIADSVGGDDGTLEIGNGTWFQGPPI